MNRRGVLAGMLGAPFAARTAAQTVASQRASVYAGGIPGTPYPGPHGVDAANVAREPLVDLQTALRTIMADKDALAEMRAELYEQNRNVMAVDPDIECMRSWSRMAKITFMRQRLVENQIAAWQDERVEGHRFLRAMRTRLDKLMWGL